MAGLSVGSHEIKGKKAFLLFCFLELLMFFFNKSLTGTEEENDNPIEQVRLTVSAYDDPNVPVLTFRTWFLGLLSCSVLACLNQFFAFRENALYIT